jgi:hypothetical protein
MQAAWRKIKATASFYPVHNFSQKQAARMLLLI